MSYPPPPGGQPPSFKTNVNRAKTKRWVEAKSYSYDGDDWGDMDEYDEYGGYDDPPTPPKPTGLRQRGQSASQDQQAVYPPHQGAYSNPEPSQHGYGPIGRQGPPPQQYGARSATNPPSQNQLTRSGSFDQGDERRAFSATFSHQGGPPPQMERYQQDPYAHPPPTSAPNYPSRAPQGNQNQPGPPVPQSATNFQDLNLPRDQPYPPPPSHRPLPPSDNIQQPSMGSRTQSMTSNSSLDFHNRRDFSPSAVPPPLHTRGSPSPQNRSDPQLGIRPPRKSSLGQHGQPQQPYADQDAETSDEQDAEGRDGMPRGRTDSNTSKPLPFVRPADIYKRMQEEKERERQSQDSSRPSLDAIMGEPGKGDEPRKDPSGAPERSHDGETRQRSKSILDPVAERKSEYGMPGAPAQDAGSKAHTAERQAPTIEAPRGVEASKPSNILRAQLPDVARMSGFGELFAGTSDPLKNLSATSASEASGLSQSPSYQPGKDPVDTPLQHQPSLGFRSVVHQAFDPNEQIPETPSSSYADSSIGRSGSGGTSVVSPIISRGPSAATPYADFRDPPIRATTPPAVNENADNERRPESSGSLGTPKAIPRKASPDPASQRPGSFIPGHRRDLSTPSPDNSPARTPALEVNEKLQQPHKAEVAMTTPIETQFPSGHSQSESSHGSRTSLVHISDTSDFATTHPSRIGRAKADAATTETPKSPADSTKSKVRSLADKFESGRSSPAGSERAPSPVKTSFLPGQTTNQYRPPAADRLESFRPRLPGGWDSSASLAPLATSSRPEATSAPISLQQRLQDREPDVSKPTAAMRNPLGGSPSRDSDRNSPTAGPTKDEASITDPFASLAAAGSALAGAFSTAMGSDNDGADKDSPTRSTFETSLEPGPMAAEGARSMTRPRNTSVNTAFIPEASKPMMLSTPDDEASSIQPTPLDKLSQPARSGQSQAVDYFAASPKPTQQASGDSYTSQDTASTKRLQLLPSISTDNGSQYESDRLRREIIRELSPRLTSEPSTAESGSQPRDAARQSTNPNSMPDRHESMVLPREYDSYWNHSGSEHSSRASSVQAPSKAVRDAMSQYNQGQTTMSPVPETASQPPTIGVEAQPVQDQLGERPEMPAHRFSWEVTNEITPPVKATLPPELPSSDNKFGDGSLSTPQGQLSTGSVAHAGQRPQGAPSLDSGPGNVEGPSQTAPSDRLLEPSGMRQAYDSQEAGFPAEPEPISTLGQSAYTDVPEPAMHESELAGTRSDVYADQDLHPHQLGSEDMLQPLESTPDVQPLPAIPSAQPKIQSFREILALKEPRDRISAYNHTREQYANSDTGLDHWLALTTANLPEHSELLPNGRLLGPADYKPPTARSKLGGLLPTGSSSAQQPYYQQYLNASAPAGSTTANQVPGGSPNQGYSPSSGSGKLSSQQMQAKGKDLLHSAGVFGGKANVAAKGLFSKGKSKFRGGNADKAPVSSFNTTHKQNTQWSSRSSPNTPPSETFDEKPSSPKHSISSRPVSLVVPPEQQPQQAFIAGKQDPSQPAPPAVGQPVEEDHRAIGPSNDLDLEDSSRKSFASDQAANGDITQDLSVVGLGSRLDTAGTPGVIGNGTEQGQQQFDRLEGVPNPHTPSSSNRTPTQADYADYFRRGSSPTAKIPKEMETDDGQHAPREELPTQRLLPQMRQDDLNPPPILMSKYSSGAFGEGASSSTRSARPDQEQSGKDQSVLQRASNDSSGTSQTAQSGPRPDIGTGTTGSYQEIPGLSQSRSFEESAQETPTETSSSSTPPVAVPAVNIQDQPKARPFSFVQFSPGPALKPLEDYSRREPSIDSTASRIDPNEDVPPSPMSAQQSTSHPQVHQPDRNDSLHYGARRDTPTSNGQGSSGPAFPSFSQRYHEHNTQDHTAVRLEQSPNRANEVPVQNHSAPIARQDPAVAHQEAREHSLEGVGSHPVPRPRNSTSTSKRGSRSSAFFRQFKASPAESPSPQRPSESDKWEDLDNQGSDKIRKTKSKRGSLFRSLTGAKASSGEVGSGELNVQNDAEPATDTVGKNESPAKGPNKYRNRLSRSATAKMEEQQQQAPSKKNRFSAIGSLFGRRDQRGSTAGLDRDRESAQDVQPQGQGRPQDHSNHTSPSTETKHRGRLKSTPENQYDYTTDKLARQGFLAPEPSRRLSKSPERSAYSQDSTQRQQSFPPRHQSLGQGVQRSDPRPSDKSWERPSNSINIRPQQTPAALAPQPVATPQQHRVQSSTVTTRSITRSSGLPQTGQQPPRFFSTTTTTTSTSRAPNRTSTQQYQQQPQSNSFARSESPPPPPPPPKDTWLQSKSHQRSTSYNSFAQTQTIRGVNDSQSSQQAFSAPRGPPPPLNNPQTPGRAAQPAYLDPPPPPHIIKGPLLTTGEGVSQPVPASGYSTTPPPPQQQAYHSQRESLPPLQTHSGPRDALDPEAREAKRSRIETPKAEQQQQPYTTTSTTTRTSGGAGAGGGAGRSREGNGDDDEPIVMSATSFPGQEWQPGYGAWDGD